MPVSYGFEILTDDYFVLSQYTYLTDRQTDGQTELRQQYRTLHYTQSHDKNQFKKYNARVHSASQAF